jgi:hypothetical protein
MVMLSASIVPPVTDLRVAQEQREGDRGAGRP